MARLAANRVSRPARRRWYWLLLGWACWLPAGPAAAQRPTAGAARSAVAFWPLDPHAGAVTFTRSVVHPMASALTRAEHARAWLTSTCSTWVEMQTGTDSVQLYRAQLRGVHAGMVLRFLLRLSRRTVGWSYRLVLFEVSSPTSYPEVVHYLPLQRLLADPDFRSDVASFQQQLQRALPGL